jgi:hypothetical protein
MRKKINRNPKIKLMVERKSSDPPKKETVSEVAFDDKSAPMFPNMVFSIL